MGDRQKVAIGFAGGMMWAAILLWIGAQIHLPVFTLVPTVMTAFLGPGIVLLLMVGVVSMRRYTDRAMINGQFFPEGSAGDIDRKVLINTVEQLVMALCIWPGSAVLLGGKGPGVIAALSGGFVLARLAFWLGYRISPPLRAFGFGATFYPTALVAGWALIRLAT